jgi:methionyl-tRNA synthetase
MTGELESFKLQSAVNTLLSLSRLGNQYLNENEPWKKMKTEKERACSIFFVSTQIIKALAVASAPIIPESSQKMWETLNLPGSVDRNKWEEALVPLPAGHRINKPKPLFTKIELNEAILEEKLMKIREKKA